MTGMPRWLGPTIVTAFVVALLGATAVAAGAQTTPAKPAPDPRSTPAQLAGPSDASGSTPTPADPPPSPAQKVTPLPVDLEHIKEEAEKQPAVKLDENQLRFYVLVLGREPKFNFNTYVGSY